MQGMTGKRTGSERDDGDPSWAAESVPMAIRKELLERELRKLGFRKLDSHGGNAQQQQQPQGEGSSHPQAGGASPGDHAD